MGMSKYRKAFGDFEGFFGLRSEKMVSSLTVDVRISRADGRRYTK